MEYIFTALFGLVGVGLGSWLTHKSSSQLQDRAYRLQKDFFKSELLIKKKSEAQYILLQMSRDFGRLMSLLVDYQNDKLTQEELIIRQHELQDKTTDKIRMFYEYKNYLTVDHLYNYEQLFMKKHHLIADKFYDIYRNPKDKNVRFYKESEHPFLLPDIEDCMMVLVNLVDELNSEIKDEVEKLNN